MEDALADCKNKSGRLLQANDLPSVLDLFYQQEFRKIHDHKLLDLVDLSYSAQDLGSKFFDVRQIFFNHF